MSLFIHPFGVLCALISISAMANIEFHFLVYPPLHCSRCSYFNIDHGQYWNSFPLISADTMQSVVNVETPLPMRPCHTGTKAILTFIARLKLARIWYNEPFHIQVISDFMQNAKRWTSEIFSREDLERVNEEFHENGTVSYETKKVSFLRRDDIPRWFYKVNDLRLF